MKQDWRTYTGLGLIAMISLLSTIFWIDALIRSAAGVTLFVSLIGIIFQLVRDDSANQREIEKADRAAERSQMAADRAHERSLNADEREARFALGVSSHMAKVAFDKHVAFCEEYAAAADNALSDIFKDGPTVDAANLAGKLFSIRKQYAVWVTKEIDDKLQQFEQLFTEIGTSAGYVHSTQGVAGAPQRREHIDRMYKNLSTLTEFPDWDGEKLDGDKAVLATIRWLRQVLGTEELNAMRRMFVQRAVTELASHDGSAGR